METTEIDLIQVYKEAGLLSEDQPFLLEASWKEFCQQVAITNSKDSEITRSSSSVVPGGIILAPRTSDTTFQRNQHIRITATGHLKESIQPGCVFIPLFTFLVTVS